MTNSGNPVSDDRLVWYAVYGSNLLRRRFDCYIQGGKAEGSVKDYVGCRDRATPRDARRVMLPYSLYFADRSESWGGAIAFIRRTVSDTRTYGRMYLMTYGQFNDVVRQENSRNVPGAIVVPPFDALADADHWEIEEFRLYAGIIKIGARHGHPILSHCRPRESCSRDSERGLCEDHCLRSQRNLSLHAETENSCLSQWH